MEFKDKDIEAFWKGELQAPRRIPPDCRSQLVRKLQMIEAATDVRDLRIPPGNHLERLQGNRFGQYSVRVSSKWRLCFRWEHGEAKEVEFCDYHD